MDPEALTHEAVEKLLQKAITESCLREVELIFSLDLCVYTF